MSSWTDRMFAWWQDSASRAALMLAIIGLAAMVLVVTVSSSLGVRSHETPSKLHQDQPQPQLFEVETRPVASLQSELLRIELQRYLTGFISDAEEVYDLCQAIDLRRHTEVGGERVVLQAACSQLQEIAQQRAERVIAEASQACVEELWAPQLAAVIHERWCQEVGRLFDSELRRLGDRSSSEQPAAKRALLLACEQKLPLRLQALFADTDWSEFDQRLWQRMEQLWPEPEWPDDQVRNKLQQQMADELRHWFGRHGAEVLTVTLRARVRLGMAIPLPIAESWDRLQLVADRLRKQVESLPEAPLAASKNLESELSLIWVDMLQSLAVLDQASISDRRFGALAAEYRPIDPAALIRAAVRMQARRDDLEARTTWRLLRGRLQAACDDLLDSDLAKAEVLQRREASAVAQKTADTVNVATLERLLSAIEPELGLGIREAVRSCRPHSAAYFCPEQAQIGRLRLEVAGTMELAHQHIRQRRSSLIGSLTGLDHFPQAGIGQQDARQILTHLRARAMPRLVTDKVGLIAWHGEDLPPLPPVRIDASQANRLVTLQRADWQLTDQVSTFDEPTSGLFCPVPYQIEAPRIDGDLSDWTAEPTHLALHWAGDSERRLDDAPSVRVAWSSHGIWFAYQLPRQQRIIRRPFRLGHSGTSLEWWFDLRADRVERMEQHALAHQFVFLPFGAQDEEVALVEFRRITRAQGRFGVLPDLHGNRGHIATREVGPVIQIEGLLAQTALSRSLLPGMRLLAECSINPDGQVENSRQWAASKVFETWDRPELWGEWHLRGTDAELQALAGPDAVPCAAVAMGQPIDVMVRDPDMDLDPDRIDVIALGLGDPEHTERVVLLRESHPNTGVFRRRLRVVGQWFGTACQPGQLITLRYQDGCTAAGGRRLRQTHLAVGWENDPPAAATTVQ